MSIDPEFQARLRSHLQAEAQKKVERDEALRRRREAARLKDLAQELYHSLACPNLDDPDDYPGYSARVIHVCRTAREEQFADGPPDLALDADVASVSAREIVRLGFLGESAAIADILRQHHDLSDEGNAVVGRLLGMVERDILKLTPDGGDALLQRLYPLVGYRVFNRDRLPELKGQSEEQQKLYRQGFPPDWWLGWERAEKWKGETFPKERSEESIRQYCELQRDIREADRFRSGPRRAEENEADEGHNLRLIEERTEANAINESSPLESKPKARILAPEKVTREALLDYIIEVRDSLDDEGDETRTETVTLIQVRKAYLCAVELGLPVRESEAIVHPVNREGAKRKLDYLLPILRASLPTDGTAPDAPLSPGLSNHDCPVASDNSAATLIASGVENPYLTLRNVLHDLFWLAARARKGEPVCDQINLTTRSWGNAESLARTNSLGWGIPFVCFDPILTDAKRTMRELVQVAAGNTAVEFSVLDRRFPQLEERMQELAWSVPTTRPARFEGGKSDILSQIDAVRTNLEALTRENAQETIELLESLAAVAEQQNLDCKPFLDLQRVVEQYKLTELPNWTRNLSAKAFRTNAESETRLLLSKLELRAKHRLGQAAAPSPGATPRGDGTPPVDEFGELREFARDKLKGQERAVIEALCDSNGELKIADLAVSDGVNWNDPDQGFKDAKRRLQPKLKKQFWELYRHDNAAKLKALKRR